MRLVKGLIAGLIGFAILALITGCDVGMSVNAKAFYPKENNGEVWKSRQANPEKPIWNWGNAGN